MTTSTTPARGSRASEAPRRSRKKRSYGVLLFLVPALSIYLLFLVYPLLRSLLGSFTEWKGIRQGGFIGFDNFSRLFEGLNLSQLSGGFLHNVIWFVTILIVQNLLGLIFAYILFTRGPRFTFFQNWFFFPAILSPVLVGALWKLLLSPGGPVEVILRATGISDEPVTWLGNSDIAIWILIGVDIWNWVGMPILVFLAGFHALNPEIFEAARLDGASPPRILTNISLPLLIPSVSTLTILTFINTFNQFDIVYVMQGVQGGPNYSTDTLVTFFYRLAFGAQGAVGITDIGLALALGALLFVFLVVIASLGLRYFNKRAEEIQ